MTKQQAVAANYGMQLDYDHGKAYWCFYEPFTTQQPTRIPGSNQYIPIETHDHRMRAAFPQEWYMDIEDAWAAALKLIS